MRTVFSDMREVAHVWAHRLQDEARSNNIIASGDSIYSYGTHFEMARWVVPTKGYERIVLYNTDTYSNTTAKHQAAVRSALPDYTTVLRVPNKEYMFKTYDENGVTYLSRWGFTALAHLFMYESGKILEFAHRQKKARSTDYRPFVRSVIENMRIAFEQFGLYEKQKLHPEYNKSYTRKQSVTVPPMLDYLNEENPKLNVWCHLTLLGLYRGGSDMPSDTVFVGDCRKQREQLVARRFVWVANVMREMGIFDYTKELGFIVDLGDYLLTELIERLLSIEGENVEGFADKVKKLEKRNKREVKKLEKRKLKELEEAITKWRSSDGVQTPPALWDLPTVLLRLVERGGEQLVETSKGIRLSIDECRRLWDFWKAIAKKGVEFRHELVLDANGHKWKVDSVDSDGCLHAGCHSIRFEEGLEMAKKLNFNID